MLHKIFMYVIAKRKMLMLRHVTLRYVRVENRHESLHAGLQVCMLAVLLCANTQSDTEANSF